MSPELAATNKELEAARKSLRELEVIVEQAELALAVKVSQPSRTFFFFL